jgi:hypothetical protein
VACLVARRTWRALLHGAGLVDLDASTTHIGVVEHRDRLFCGCVIRHLNEGESAWATRFAVHWNEHGNDFTGLGKVLSEFLIRGAEGDTTDEQLCGHA